MGVAAPGGVTFPYKSYKSEADLRGLPLSEFRQQHIRGVVMKGLIIAAAGAVVLSGCVAVPAHYPDHGYYYHPAPASVGVSVYSAPAYYPARPYYRHHHRHRRHYHRW
jgi:hypothetical protein